MARKLYQARYMKEHAVTIKADSLKAAAKVLRKLGAKRAVIIDTKTQQQETL